MDMNESSLYEVSFIAVEHIEYVSVDSLGVRIFMKSGSSIIFIRPDIEADRYLFDNSITLNGPEREAFESRIASKAVSEIQHAVAFSETTLEINPSSIVEKAVKDIELFVGSESLPVLQSLKKSLSEKSEPQSGGVLFSLHDYTKCFHDVSITTDGKKYLVHDGSSVSEYKMNDDGLRMAVIQCKNLIQGLHAEAFSRVIEGEITTEDANALLDGESALERMEHDLYEREVKTGNGIRDESDKPYQLS